MSGSHKGSRWVAEPGWDSGHWSWNLCGTGLASTRFSPWCVLICPKPREDGYWPAWSPVKLPQGQGACYAGVPSISEQLSSTNIDFGSWWRTSMEKESLNSLKMSLMDPGIPVFCEECNFCIDPHRTTSECIVKICRKHRWHRNEMTSQTCDRKRKKKFSWVFLLGKSITLIGKYPGRQF